MKNQNRRDFLKATALSASTLKKYCLLLFILVSQILSLSPAKENKNTIDRHTLVNRHNVRLTVFDKMSPLSVGNGKFAFTADLTGLQTFSSVYSEGIPLTTMAEWGWHSMPNKGSYKYENTLVERDTFGRMVTYPLNTKVEGGNYFRANPHQSNLARLGFILKNADGTQAQSTDITDTRQTLKLWNGILESHFKLDGQDVDVETFCHPRLDMIVVNVTSDLITAGRLALSIKFPYANTLWGRDPSDWNSPDAHTTKIVTRNPKESKLLRQMDAFSYQCIMQYSQKADLAKISPHKFSITPSGQSNTLQFCMQLTTDNIDSSIIDLAKSKSDCIEYWKHFWSAGGAIDLSGSTDPRWRQLERRIVLSQYLTAIQSAQKYPPQETGLTCNSWHGKFHLEMHWWHGVHFALWDRLDMLERSMGWYQDALPAARQLALRQGYEGVRWPKMVGPEGIDSPSSVGPLLIWQQPHPIYYAELIYRQHPTRKTLDEYKEIVFASAKFMADYAHWNAERKSFQLGPPLITAREKGSGRHAKTKNPAFELAYWAWGLEKANQWRKRLGLAPLEQWDTIAKNMAPLPIREGVYVEMETPIVDDVGHPCMLAAYGLLPENYLLDKKVMRKTLKHVMANWNWTSTWGWDYPMIAMTAARLNEGEIAINALLKDVTKNTYLPNGHNFQAARLPIYLPGNGGLLTAAAMMAEGWDGCPDRPAPGFPDNGKWVVKYEGFKKMP